MSKNRISKMKANIYNTFTNIAKQELKTNAQLKLVIKDLRVHFRKNDAWRLDFRYYKQSSCVSIDTVFIRAIELSGFKVMYCKKSANFLIDKSK